MFSTITLAFLFCALHGSFALVTEEYHWKEFKGEVPEDAIVGGQSANGKPIYIGQVLYFDKLLPAKIYNGDEKAYFAWNREQTATTNIKILCSSKPDMLKWVRVTKDTVHLLTDHHVISGGTEPNHNIYIGRAAHKSETLPGRVRTGDRSTQNLGLSVTADGKVINLDSFEILVYETEPGTTEIRHCNKKVVIIRN